MCILTFSGILNILRGLASRKCQKILKLNNKNYCQADVLCNCSDFKPRFSIIHTNKNPHSGRLVGIKLLFHINVGVHLHNNHTNSIHMLYKIEKGHKDGIEFE